MCASFTLVVALVLMVAANFGSLFSVSTLSTNFSSEPKLILTSWSSS